MIEIIDYSGEYANDFRELNLEWLEKYNLTESHDLEVINHPTETILDKGGFIFLASEGDSTYELVKMTVAPAFRGQGISKMLIEKCLDKARELKAKKIFLYSNSQLQTAISLYKKYGFVHVDASNSPLVPADIKMELTFEVM